MPTVRGPAARQARAEAERVEQERQARIAQQSDPRQGLTGPRPVSRDVFGGGFLGGDPAAAAAQQTYDTNEAAARAKYDANEATDERYGNEFSWLDPTFQREAALAKYDPNAIGQQSAAMDRAHALANENLNFSDPALQQKLGDEWAKIQGGAGAPQFAGDADQRRVLDQALGFSTNQGPGSLVFDDGSRQREQYGNLQGIIAGGGATAIEMADRARGRADSESWLRGQREADMANYAERGLTGSGMELLNLSADRQGAAQRNSLADLETAKALEERRKSAINDAGGLATDMRGQTIDEQALLNQRTTTGLGAAGSIANAMRGADFDEKSYLDKRTIDALAARTDLQNKMRDQTYQEQIGNRNAQQSALNTWSDTAGQARSQGAQESQWNADQVNKANSDNKTFLQDQYDSTQRRKQDRYLEELRLKSGVAEGLMGSDQRDNVAGSDQGTRLGEGDADTANAERERWRNARIKANDPTGVLGAQDTRNKYIGEAGAFGGAVVDAITTNGASAVDLGGKGGGAAPAVGSSTSALTQTQPNRWRPKARTATAGGAAYDPEKLRKAMGY